MHERGGGGEADREAFLTGGQAQPEGNMGFACSAWAEGDGILPPLDPFAPGQFQFYQPGEDMHMVQPLGRTMARQLVATSAMQ